MCCTLRDSKGHPKSSNKFCTFETTQEIIISHEFELILLTQIFSNFAS